tara:strand:- start:52205 stop:53701 length:1497 start_codon:yes stop_codon:yes gene_type:complete
MKIINKIILLYLMLFLFSCGGNKNWSRILDDNGSSFSSIQRTKDGGYIVTGYLIQDSHPRYNYATRSELWLLKIDKNGSPQWNKRFNSNTSGWDSKDYGHIIKQTQDDGYIIVGQALPDHYDVGNCSYNLKFDPQNKDRESYKQDERCPEYHSYSNWKKECVKWKEIPNIEGCRRGWIIKTDKNGIEQWNKFYMDYRIDEIIDIEELSNTNFIVAANTYDSGYVIMEIDDQGDIIWIQNNHLPKYHKSRTGISDISISSNNGYLLTGWVSNKTWLRKIDTKGNEQWTKLIDNNHKLDYNNQSLIEIDNGDIIVATSVSAEQTPDILRSIALLKYNANGDLKSVKHYPPLKRLNYTKVVESIVENGGEHPHYDLEFEDRWLLGYTDTSFGTPIIKRCNDGGYGVLISTDDKWWSSGLLKIDENENSEWLQIFNGGELDNYGGTYDNGPNMNNFTFTDSNDFILVGSIDGVFDGGFIFTVDKEGNYLEFKNTEKEQVHSE